MGLNMKRYLDIWTAKKLGIENGRDLLREDIDRYTEKKLRQTVDYAAGESSFYRERLQDFIREKEQCSDCFMELFQRLPFTYPDDLRRNSEDFLCVSPGRISRIVTLDTGGSTGRPKRIWFTEEDQKLTIDFFQNGMQLLVGKRDKVLILMPSRAPGSIGVLLAQGLENIGIEAVEYGLPERGAAEAAAILRLIKEQGLTSVVALPTHMRLLAEETLRGSRTVSLRSVLLSAEYVKDSDVRLIEEVFGCRVFQHYGMTEMGLGCAVSCSQGEGYHIREGDLYLEIIDPDTGEVIEDESPGEIVFTTLTRKGMPFIRYRTGDFSHWINQECACGSILKRIAKVGPRDEVKGYLRI